MQGVAERDAQGEEIVRALDRSIITHYHTFGRYDIVVIVYLPSDEAVAKALIEIGKWGTISTETVTALLPEQVYQAAKETR